MATVRAYYEKISAGDYEGALAVREPGRRVIGAGDLAASFAGYREHHARPGVPSHSATAGNWVYVEVPVHLYGRLSDGRPFNTAGTVTLRKPRQGGRWRIYTG